MSMDKYEVHFHSENDGLMPCIRDGLLSIYAHGEVDAGKRVLEKLERDHPGVPVTHWHIVSCQMVAPKHRFPF